jgi:hypothetical protein
MCYLPVSIMPDPRVSTVTLETMPAIRGEIPYFTAFLE